MTLLEVPICSCGHPLDAHDVKERGCIIHGCSCVGFVDSGLTEKVQR